MADRPALTDGTPPHADGCLLDRAHPGPCVSRLDHGLHALFDPGTTTAAWLGLGGLMYDIVVEDDLRD